MAPAPLRKLIALQEARFAEMRLSSTRLHEKERSLFNVNIVKSRLDALTALWNDARATHSEIVTREEAADSPYMTSDAFNNLHELYEDTADFLLTLLSEIEIPSPTPPNLNETSFVDFELRAAKLPKLYLPTFSGEYEEWENFCDLFTTLVHNAPRIADATKLQYLKTCLKGAAADLVKDVAMTNANYSTTWQALKVRFHNPRLIVFTYLQAFLEIPYLRKESATDLRSFTDEAQRIVRALANLKMPVQHWDIWFAFLLSSRLDPESHKAWETKLSARDRSVASTLKSQSSDEGSLAKFPRFTELAEFLEDRARTLSMIASESNRTDKRQPIPTKPLPGSRKVLHATFSSSTVDEKLTCPLCSGAHRLFKCYKFKEKSPHERRNEVRRLRLCYNCLGPHLAADCLSAFRCLTCKEKHHTTIHDDSRSSSGSGGEPALGSGEIRAHTTSLGSRRCSVILATAQLVLVGARGGSTRIRVLLDQGSESSFITTSLAALLSLPKQRIDMNLKGFGDCSAGIARSSTRFTIRSLVDSSFQLEVEALIHPKLTARLPSRQALEIDPNVFADLPLADPQFYIPDSVDVILGADVYGLLLRPGLRQFNSLRLTDQDTALGWIVSGRTHVNKPRRTALHTETITHALHCAMEPDLDESLNRFWQLEELPPLGKQLTPLEETCERLFRESHTRDASGRFEVRLPLKSEPPGLAAETRHIAVRSLSSLHRRFARDPKLAAEYREFMTIYERLGHMERIPEVEVLKQKAWYIPHHAVVRSSPFAYKLRVVFDASRKTRENQCLNDFLLLGPPLQRDLSLVLLNWRQYRYVFTADIVKMFRQIRVRPEDQDWQRVLWSPCQTEHPVEYRLTTVTYGTTCAPYLAIRTLLQLADEGREKFPHGAKCLELNTYVDDTFAGANDLSKAMRIRQELCDLLSSAEIELDKWAANHSELLPSRPADGLHEESKTISLDDSVKTLGIRWDPMQDEFKFTAMETRELTEALTKPAVLSSISRLFDPLGWLAPITVTAKILMQDLWILKTGWDEHLPVDVRQRWLEYC